MRDESLDVPSPTVPAAYRRPAAPQLLVEMPADTATRLLVRSLLEQVLQLATSHGDAPSGGPSGSSSERWRAASHRLSTCVSLYAESLVGSISRKSRRRLRDLARRAERANRASVQLAWLRRSLTGLPSSDDYALANAGSDVAAAAWLSRRVVRRQLGSAVSSKRASRDANRIRTLVRDLGVYTTAVKLDDVAPPPAFSRFTGNLLRRESKRLRKHGRDVGATSVAFVRRSFESVRRLEYLLEPIRMHVRGLTAISGQLSELHAELERLVDLCVVANLILRAGRRAGARYMTSVLRVELFGAPQQNPSAENGDESAVADAEGDQRAGLVALARQLQAELAPAFERFTRDWSDERIGRLCAELDACAELL